MPVYVDYCDSLVLLTQNLAASILLTSRCEAALEECLSMEFFHFMFTRIREVEIFFTLNQRYLLFQQFNPSFFLSSQSK